MRARREHGQRVVLEFADHADDEVGAEAALRKARASIRIGDRRDRRLAFRTRRCAGGGWEVEISYHGHTRLDVAAEIRKKHPKLDVTDVPKRRR